MIAYRAVGAENARSSRQRVSVMSGDDEEQQPSGAKAVVVTMSKFRLPVSEEDLEDEEPPGRSPWRDLAFAPDLGDRLLSELAPPLVEAQPAHLQELDSQSLRARMDDVLATIDGGDRVIVHVLSHGFLHRSSPTDLYVAATDTRAPEARRVLSTAYNVRNFLIEADDRPGHLLLLLDVCHGGGAIDWTRNIEYAERRTFVIAACPPKEQAWGGRFSQAVCDVLSRLMQGHGGIHPSERYVRLTWFKEEVHRTVRELCEEAGDPVQEVISSELEGPRVEFLLNPWFRGDPAEEYELKNYWALRHFMSSIHPAVDVDHYISKASGRHDVEPGQVVCLFSGREEQLEQVADWLADGAEQGATLCVVTGSPGVGKSAMLGVVVCCTQRQLAKVLDSSLVRQIPLSVRPQPRPLVAAVHVREMTLARTVDNIAVQLGLDEPEEGWSAQGLVDAVAKLPQEPLIVVDALDEAIESVQITVELLLPLANQVFPDGLRRRACQLLVGVRPQWDKLPQLAAAVSADSHVLVDLDTVDRGQLRCDLTVYVERLLAETPAYAADRRTRKLIARAVAERVEGSTHGGEFLKAQMAARSIAVAAPLTKEAIDNTLAAMPLSFAALLEDQLTDEHTHPWARRIMTALAFGAGNGMPHRMVSRFAAGLPPVCPEPSREETDTVLTGMSFYLRRDVDPDDGTTLYRLFHQELVDHLRASAEMLPDPRETS
ncbi:AAA family ATPase [Streptomyces sp. NPDC002917]|uniref:AAA family ATPase n=1 Tax=Streptomyces sp. NPDC002917 TaxID=3364671 RepID=UPI003699F0AE